MRSVDVLLAAFDRWKADFNPFLIISLETFLISMVAQIIIIPFAIIIFFIVMFSTLFIDSFGIIILIVLIGIMYVVLIILGTLLAAFLNPGVVNAVEKQFRGEKISFGDVFKYGRSVFRSYIGLVLLNMLISFTINAVVLGTIGGLILLVMMVAPVVIFFGVAVLYLSLLIISIVMLPTPYLIFIIRYKEGASSWECIRRSYMFVFRNFTFCLALGSLVLIFILALSMVPLLSIVISLFMMTFMETVFLQVYYEMDV